MNIFDQYLDKIKKILIDLSKNDNLILPDKLDGITAEIPPSKFDSDISTNVAMVLSKVNKKSPTDLATTLAEAIKKKDELIENISIIKPGFINIKFKSIFWTNFIEEVVKNSKTFGKHFTCILSEKNCKSIFVPPGFAHGFQALDKENFIIYSCTKYRDKRSETSINFNDEDLEIKWPNKKPIVSIKDKNAISFFQFNKNK